MASHHQPNDLRAQEIRAKPGPIRSEVLGEGCEQLRRDEFADHPRGLGVGRGGPDQADDTSAAVLGVENLEKEPSDALADRSPVPFEQARHHVRRPKWQLDDGHEQALLGAVEVGYEPRIDARLERDPAQRGAVIAQVGELSARCSKDRPARPAVAQTAPRRSPARRPAGGHPRGGVLRS